MQTSGVNTTYPIRRADAAPPWAAPVLLVVMGCLALAVGLLVYVADRDATRVWLLPHSAVLHGGPLFGALGDWLPSFVHTLAFSLLSAAALRRKAAPAYGTCAAWWAVNLAFEAAQHPQIRDRLAGVLRLAGGPDGWTDALTGYFSGGTFDVGDIAAATAGALAAAAALWLVHQGETRYAQ